MQLLRPQSFACRLLSPRPLLLRLPRVMDCAKDFLEGPAALLDVNHLCGLSKRAIEDMNSCGQLHGFAGFRVVHQSDNALERGHRIHAGEFKNLPFCARVALWIAGLAWFPEPWLFGRKDFDFVHVRFSIILRPFSSRASALPRPTNARVAGEPSRQGTISRPSASAAAIKAAARTIERASAVRRQNCCVLPRFPGTRRAGRTIGTSQSSSWRRQPQPRSIRRMPGIGTFARARVRGDKSCPLRPLRPLRPLHEGDEEDDFSGWETLSLWCPLRPKEPLPVGFHDACSVSSQIQPV